MSFIFDPFQQRDLFSSYPKLCGITVVNGKAYPEKRTVSQLGMKTITVMWNTARWAATYNTDRNLPLTVKSISTKPKMNIPLPPECTIARPVAIPQHSQVCDLKIAEFVSYALLSIGRDWVEEMNAGEFAASPWGYDRFCSLSVSVALSITVTATVCNHLPTFFIFHHLWLVSLFPSVFLILTV